MEFSALNGINWMSEGYLQVDLVWCELMKIILEEIPKSTRKPYLHIQPISGHVNFTSLTIIIESAIIEKLPS